MGNITNSRTICCHNLTVVNDDIVESEEQLQVDLLMEFNVASVLLAPITANVTIDDADSESCIMILCCNRLTHSHSNLLFFLTYSLTQNSLIAHTFAHSNTHFAHSLTHNYCYTNTANIRANSDLLNPFTLSFIHRHSYTYHNKQ